MAFMQRAMDKQRARAKEEASLLLRELEEVSAAAADEDGSDADTRVTDKRKSNQSRNVSSLGVRARDVSTEERTRAAEEIAEVLPVGTLRSSAVGMDSRARSSVSAPISIDLGGSSEGHGSSVSTSVAASAAAAKDAVEQDGEGEEQALKDGAVEGLSAAAVSTRPDLDPALEGLGGSGNGDKNGGVGAHVLDDVGEESDEGNPWLVPTPRRSRERRRASGVTGEILLDVGKAAATALSAFGGALSEGGDKDSGIDGEEKRKMDVGGGNLHAGNATVGSNVGGNSEAIPVSGSIDVQRNHSAKKRKKRQGGGGDVEGKASGSEKEGGVKRPKHMEDGNGDAAAVTGELTGLSNDELVRRAFAAPDFEAEFKASKDHEIEAEVSGQRREKLPKEMAGWGSWTGEGAPVASGPSKREKIALKEQVCVAVYR